MAEVKEKTTVKQEGEKEKQNRSSLETKEDGDDDLSHIQHAKHLLHLAKSDKDLDEKGKEAVILLIKLSKNANEEATQLLQQCLKNKTGITEETRSDVQWCLETSSLEKRLREASRRLFRTIHNDSSEQLSFKDYVKKVKATGMDSQLQRILISAGKEQADDITEEKISQVLSGQIQGTLNMTSSERESLSNEFKSADMFTKVHKYPMETFQVAVQMVQDTISTAGMSWITNILPTNQLYMISSFFLYSILSASLLLFVIPLLVFYLTLAVMVICTTQIVISRQNLKKGTMLANFLKTFDKHLDTDASKSKFLKNSLAPYLIFLAVVPVFIASLAMANKKYIPCSDLAVLSSVIAVITFIFFTENILNLTRLIAVFLNVVSSLPTLLHNFPNVPVISKIVNLVCKRFYSLDTDIGLTINVSFPSISYAILPILFLVMAVRHSGAGSYRTLLPFLVTQVWFSFAVSLFPYTTWFGLIRASVGNAFLPVLLPFSILFGVFYGMYQAFQASLFFKIVLASLLGLVPLILSQTGELLGSGESSKKSGSMKKYVILIFGVLGFLPLTSISLPSPGSSVPFKFDFNWNEYNRLCVSGDGNRIPSQNYCRQLIGQKVTWNGTFEGAKIVQVTNSIESMLTGLPVFLVNKIRCIFGEEFGNCSSPEMSDTDQIICKLMASAGQTCHFNDQDSFRFNLFASMPNFEGRLSIEASDGYKDILEILKTGDIVEMTITLGENQGTKAPKFQLKDIRCVSRMLPLTITAQKDDDEVLFKKATNEAISTIVNFFWFPVLEYAPHM